MTLTIESKRLSVRRSHFSNRQYRPTPAITPGADSTTRSPLTAPIAGSANGDVSRSIASSAQVCRASAKTRIGMACRGVGPVQGHRLAQVELLHQDPDRDPPPVADSARTRRPRPRRRCGPSSRRRPRSPHPRRVGQPTSSTSSRIRAADAGLLVVRRQHHRHRYVERLAPWDLLASPQPDHHG